MTYRGCEYHKTATTTTGTRQVFGETRECIKYIWVITGRLDSRTLPDGSLRGEQWLTSAAACRRWIREQDMLAGE